MKPNSPWFKYSPLFKTIAHHLNGGLISLLLNYYLCCNGKIKFCWPDKNIFKKIQNDIKKSNPKIVNSSDDLSNIKRNLGSKYTEDLSDSSDDLSSYKLRNRDVINQMKTKPKSSENIKVKPTKHTMSIAEEIDEMAKEINNSTSSTFRV